MKLIRPLSKAEQSKWMKDARKRKLDQLPIALQFVRSVVNPNLDETIIQELAKKIVRVIPPYLK